MASYTLEQLTQWTQNAGPKVQNVGTQLQQARAQIQALNQTLSNLTRQKNQVEANISRLRGEIAALESQLNSIDDEEDSGSAQAIRSQISALQGQLAQYENVWHQVVSGIQQARAQLRQQQQEASVSAAKLEEMDGALDAIDDGFTEHLQEGIEAKERFSRLAAGRFGSSEAASKAAVMQERINICMSFQSQIRNMRAWIQQLLGSGPEDREKELTLGRSR